MAPRQRCPTCGSKQWHKEPSSGLIACSEGHVLQNYRNETIEMEEAGQHLMKKRTLKSDKKKKGRESQADPKLYHGARGRYHYFLCLQLILRNQIAALTKLWELPPEFEVICKDLWALYLTLLPNPPPAEPYLHAQENQEGDEDIDIGAANQPQESKVNDEDLENELELEALMQENSDIYSSDEDGEDLITTDNTKPGKYKRGLAYESPASTIAVLVVGCWTLRIPVMYRNFSRIIEMYKLPYLEAVELLPESMVLHLTKHNIRALSPHHAPSTLTMHSLASKFAKKIYAKFGVYTPELNASSVLWRITKDMGGTPMLYMLSKRVANVLSIPLTLHSSLAPRLRSGGPHRHQRDSAPTEVGLLAAMVIVLKMVYGLDGSERQPRDEGDVAWALPKGQEYLKGIEGKKREVKFDSQIDLKVGDMSESVMDEYMKFCKRVLVKTAEADEGWLVMEADDDVEEGEEEVEEIRIGCGVEFIGEEKGLPGSCYNILNGRDVCGIVEDEYGKVLCLGGKVVGVPVEYLGVVIEHYERRLMACGN
ncbi:hypothetical protein BYT27DRAFT_7252044 [Phlegmacium glaucopus]|nr:hypothetical protein BYT27DRAFT_7252044 [Phlegmacium glaucopus]